MHHSVNKSLLWLLSMAGLDLRAPALPAWIDPDGMMSTADCGEKGLFFMGLIDSVNESHLL